MNKNLHKLIFNRNLGLMIAVCEITHNSGKSTEIKFAKSTFSVFQAA
ncbi:MAG: hypothetical protein IK065_06600 [Neisseriaceae bacterium]|nr:hypothetical protein [Neisseriaceae bacterium]